MILNQITFTEIGRLGDVPLSKLLLRLLLLESQKYKFEGVEKIVVPLRINVGDAGEDGRVVCKDTKTSKWVLNKYTIYQCKATNLTPKEFYDEFFTLDEKKQSCLKEQIENVLDNNGQYVFFIRKDYNEDTTNTRIEKIKEAIDYANINLGKKYSYDQVRILEGNQIAIWTNEYISAVTLVQEYCGIHRPFGFRTWQQWHETTKHENRLQYARGELLKKLSDEILDTINREKVVRIIGHSGIGKTRLILETFSPTSDISTVFSDMLVYVDLAIIQEKELIGFLLNSIDYYGLLIIDNCNESSHSTISSLIKSTGNLKLITIDHSIDTQEKIYFKLDKNLQKETTESIIKNKYRGKIPDWAIDKLIELSDGYPKMVGYICDSVDNDGVENINLSLPKEEVLNIFIKKLIFGHHQEDRNLYSVIRACSIFKEFGFIDHAIESITSEESRKSVEAQIKVISEIACIPQIAPEIFYTTVLYFKNNREIIDRKGYNYYVRPEPLASNLAADWLLNFNLNNARDFSEKLNEVGLLEQFCLRLQSLDQIPRAKYVVQKLWETGSPFVSAEVLNTEMGSRLFRSVVDVNPEVTSKSLRAFIKDKSKEEIMHIREGRRYLIWAIEKLLYREEAFYDAARTLFDFAAAENETIGNNATNQFLQLYHIYLPATVADFNSRIEILKYGLSKKSLEYDKIVVQALGRALKGDNFSRMSGAEKQGSALVFQDYQPKNEQELIGYWKYAMESLTEFALTNNELRALAMEQIAGSIRTLFFNNQSELIATSIRRIYSATLMYWEEAIRGINLTLQYGELNEKNKRIAIELIKYITPNDISNKFKMFVSKPDWSHEKDDKGNYIDVAANRVVNFVSELHEKGIDLNLYMNLLLEGEQRQGFNFGINVSKMYANQLEIGNAIIDELKKVKKENRNPEVLAGLLSDSPKNIKEKLLSRVLEDNDVNIHSFYLTAVSKPNINDLFKLFVLVDKNPSWVLYFNQFNYGRVLDTLTTNEVIDFCDKISQYDTQGKWLSLAIISHYSFNNKDLWDTCKPFIKNLLGNGGFLKNIDTVRTMDGYHWSSTIIKILKEDSDSKFAENISSQILEGFQGSRLYSVDVYLKNICQELAKEYFEVFWKKISEGISSGKGYINIKFTLGSHNSNSNAPDIGILFQGDTQLIFEWCKRNKPKGARRIAYMMPLYECKEKKVIWHSFATKMINEFGEDEDFMNELRANLGSFSSIGSTIGYYEMQIDLMNQLINHPSLPIKTWAKSMLSSLQKNILYEKLNEEIR